MRSPSPGWALGRSLLVIAGGYLAFGLLWILLSDWAASLLVPSAAALSRWQTLKGSAFVVLSAGLIGVLVWRERDRLRASEEHWRDIVEHAQEGFWRIDEAGRTVAVNRALADLLGYAPEELHGRTPFEFADGDSQAVFAEQIGRGGEPGVRHRRSGTRTYEATLVARDGRTIPVLLHATSLHDGYGRLTASYAFLTDLTEIRSRERELYLTRHAIERSFDEIFRVAPDGRILAANRTAASNLGYAREELEGMAVAEVDPNFPASAWPDHWTELRRRGAMAFETRHRSRDGTDYPVEVGLSHAVHAGEEYGFAVARDITQRKAAEEARQRSERALRALSRANSALIHATDEASLLRGVCQALTEGYGYPLAWVGWAEEDAAKTVRPVAAAGAHSDYPESVRVGWGDDELGRGPTGRAVRTGQPQVARGLGSREDFEPWREAVRQRGLISSAAIPIRRDGAVAGVLNVYSEEEAAFGPEEVGLFQELTQDIAFGLDNLRARAEQERALSRLRQAAAVFRHSAEGIAVTDPDERIVAVNEAFTRITGYTEPEVLGEPPRILRSDVHDADFYRSLWESLQAEGVWQGEVWNRRKDGEVYPEWQTISEVRDEQGELVNYVAVFTDISRVRQKEQELAFLTYHDPLTGLPNRALFREHLDHALESLQRKHRGLAVVSLDLEGFGTLNDSLGAQVGDRVLQRVGERLQRTLRPGDTASRPGADEFWVLLEDLSHSEDASKVVQKLLAALREPLTVEGRSLRLEAAVGVALAPVDSTDAQTLIANATTAQHRAQPRGAPRVQFFSQDMGERAARHLELEQALKGAIENEELRVWYQPQIDLASNRTVGLEALVRWQHPEWGLVPPGDFIAVAEASGLVVPLGEWVLGEAVRQFAAWRSQGHPLERLGVNVAAGQLNREDLAEQLAGHLRRAGVPAGCVELEITEEGFLADLEASLATINRITTLGARLAIDDFGTGYSSLAYLKRLPVDTLKIDKAFIDGLPDDDHNRTIIEAILAVASKMGLGVVAEGVEAQAQADWLHARGVPLAQGFLWSRPMPAEALADHLAGGESAG